MDDNDKEERESQGNPYKQLDMIMMMMMMMMMMYIIIIHFIKIIPRYLSLHKNKCFLCNDGYLYQNSVISESLS